jgi:hypothetical protein
LEDLPSHTRHNVLQILRQLISEPVVDVQLALARGRQVLVVDEERRVDQRLVVLLHGRLPGRGSARLATRRGGSSHGARSDVELALKVFHFKPERQVLLAKVALQELAEQGAERGVIENVLETIGVALLARPMRRLVVELLRDRDAPMNLGI